MRGLLKGMGVLLVLLLGATAVVLTTSRLFEPSGTQWIQAEAFTPYAMIAYGVVLIVSVVALVRVRHRAGRVLSAVLALTTLVGAAGLGAHLAWFLPQVRGAIPAPADGSPVIAVMTANQYAGEADPVGLLEAATDADVDILVVQEITRPALRRLTEAGVDEAFPHRVGEPIEGIFGTMVFSRFELGEPVDLPTEMASFSVPVDAAGERLDLVAVHPAPPTRAQQWSVEQRALGDWVQTNEPDLVVGDFNATADHAPMRSLASAGYRSVTEVANEGWRPTWPSNRRLFGVLPIPPLVQIDHVLCGPTMTAVRSRTVQIEGSDHRAVLAHVASG